MAIHRHSNSYLAHLLVTAALLIGNLYGHTPDRILVLANQNSDDSLSIAEYYLQKREIPRSQLCIVKTTTSEAIDRTSFEQEILRPVAHFLASDLLQDQILYIVTTQGLPLIVEGDAGPVGDLASVDSELALLYRYLVFGEYTYLGRIENPYFTYDSARAEFQPFDRGDFDIYLVTRLMGNSVQDVEALVDRSLSVPNEPGAYYLDLRSHRSAIPAGWLKETADLLQAQGLHVTQDEPAGKTLAGYVSWNPLEENGLTPVLWAPGALAVVLGQESQSLLSEADEDREVFASIAAAFVSSGSTGFGGFVADPTTDGNFRPNVLFPSYIAGYNLAESFYRSLRYLSWRHVVVGDPLVSAYGDRSAAERAKIASRTKPEIDAFTGLPFHYSRRRTLFLTARYSTAQNAVRSLLRAERLSAQKQWADALQSVDSCLQQDASIPAAHLLKAQLLERENMFGESFSHYQQAAELGKASKELYYKLVELAQSQAVSIEEVEPYARWLYVRFGSQEKRAVRYWAEVQWKLGKLKEAAATYHKLLEEDDSEAFLYLSALGEIYYELENWEAAKVYLEKALDFEIPPESASKASPSSQSSKSKPQAAGHTPQPTRTANSVSNLEFRISNLQTLLASVNDKLAIEQAEAEIIEEAKTPEIIPARVVHRTPVAYPKGAKESRTQGEVVLKLLIDEEGKLLKSEALMGPKSLAKEALKAVQDWRFEPRKVRGRPEPSLLTVRIEFKLERP